MLRKQISDFVGGRTGIIGTAMMLLALLVAPAQAQVATNPPPNDNFASALVLAGDTGVVPGDNTAGTLQIGESNIVALAPVGASIWYSWTATNDGTYTFDTSSSLIDTVLGVYTGTAVDALTEVGANDDFGGTFQSSVTFDAVSGTTYYLGIYGWDYAMFGLDVQMGKVFLHWAPGGGRQAVAKAGDFHFTRTTFPISEFDSFPAQESNMDYRPARVTVTRSGGSAGKVYVGYSITNGFYTNQLILDIFGTNISLANKQKELYTNYLVATRMQTYSFNRYVYLETNYTAFFTNVIGGATNGGAYVVAPTLVNTNFSYDVTNAVGAVDKYDVFYYQANSQEIVPSAIPRDPLKPGGIWDYRAASNAIVFNDFQMSADINPIFTQHRMSFGPAAKPLVNPLVYITLTEATLDPLESNDISPPTISQSEGLLNILNARVLPSMGMIGTNVFNFERSTIECTESVRNTGVALIHVSRASADSSSATSVPYRIDYLYPYDNDHNMFDLQRFEFALQAGSEYATPDKPSRKFGPNSDFTSVTGTVDFPAFVDDAIISIPIVDDNLVEFNEDLLVQLYFPDPQPTDKWLGNVRTCVLTIEYDEEPAGALDRLHNRDSFSDTTPPYNAYPGANSTVYSVVVQQDGNTLLAGDFTSLNTIARNRIARMKPDGQIDLGFAPGDGADQVITCMQLDNQGRILIGGAFSAYNRTTRNGIARLMNNGSLDLSFKPGLGANDRVWAVAHAVDGSIYIAGDFTMVNGTNRNHIARLLADGSLDSTFNPGFGTDGSVYSVAAGSDGRVVIGGQFNQYGGVARSCIARLNGDGSLDESFNPRSGAGGAYPAVFAVALQGTKVLVGGIFNTMYGIGRNNIARLAQDGSLDLTFDPGTGTDNGVFSLLAQVDNKILIGGNFTSYNGTRRVGLARVYSDGILDTTFLDTAYNHFAGVPTAYWNPFAEPKNYIYSMSLQPDGKVMIGGSFESVGGGWSRDDMHPRRNVARLLGGETPGPGNIELADSEYSADIPPVTGSPNPKFITMNRLNGNLGPASVTIAPVVSDTGAGIAQADVDYSFDSGKYGDPTWTVTYPYPTWQLSDGTWGQNNGYSDTVNPNYIQTVPENDVYVDILSSTNKGNRQVVFKLSTPRSSFQLGGEEIPLGVALGRTTAQLTMLDGTRSPGMLTFVSTNYIVNEGTNAYITVIRTNGVDNRITVQYATANLGATNGVHYTGITNALVFNAGVTSQTFTVATKNRTQVEKTQTVLLRLFNPSAGVGLGVSNAVLTIVDKDVAGGYAELTATSYVTNEASVAAIVGVTRLGSSAGSLSVDFSTANGNAHAGVNYTAVSTNLIWPNGDVGPKFIAIPLIRDQVYQDTNFLSVNLRITNPKLNGNLSPVSLGLKTNAVLTIVNADFRGQLAFGLPVYTANENGGPAIVTVNRTGGSAEAVSVNYSTSPGTAFPGIDYISTNGTLFFAPGEVSKSFAVGLIDNIIQDPADRFITLSLSVPSVTNLISKATAIISLVDDESLNQPPGGYDNTADLNLGADGNVYALALQPDGRILLGGEFGRVNDTVRSRIARLFPDGSLDTKFGGFEATSGANDKIQTITVQGDGRILIGGSFTVVNGVPRNYVGRLNYDGSTDSTFNPGAGPENAVLASGEAMVGGQRKLLLGGSFLTYNGNPRNYLVRLNDDGSIDTGFNRNINPNGTVHAILVLVDGSAIIAGDFTTVSGVARSRIARITPDGSLDLTFDPGTGADDSVRSLALQADGKILVGGSFTTLSGVAASKVGRLLVNGSVDPTFNTSGGANDVVSTIAVQGDTRILLGGQFTACNGVVRQRLTRLNNDGSVDTTINFGAGADSFIASMLLQPDGKILIGGGFTTWDGRTASHIARVFGGSITGSGTIEFTETQYVVGESVTNAYVTVRRRGGTSGTASGPNVSIQLSTSNGTAIAGSNYTSVATNIIFPPGEVLRTVMIPVVRDFAITPDLTVNLTLSSPLPSTPEGPQLGNISASTLVVLNDDSAVSFSSAAYQRNENALEGSVTIPINRVGSSRGVATVQFLTTTNGTALAGTNYSPIAEQVTFKDGETNAYVYIPLIYDSAARGNVTVTMELTNAFNALLFSPSSSTLTIVDVDRMPGQLAFGQTNFLASEGAGYAQVTIIRTNGRSGTVSVNFSTAGGTAAPNAKYGVTNGTLVFSDGEISKTIGIPIFQNLTVEGNQYFEVTLSNPTGGSAILGSQVVPVTILDDDVGVAFSSPIYIAPESAGIATLTLTRVGTNGVTTVDYATTNSTAMAGTNYMATTGTLSFTNGETIKTFSINLLRDPRVTGDLSFNVNLLNPSTPAQLYAPSSATVVVLDADPGVAFTNSAFGVYKSGTNVLISVYRTNANTGDIAVRYNTYDLTASAGVDYVATSGLLTFSNGVALQSFNVPIINNRLVQSDVTFGVRLFSPTLGAQILDPGFATITITNDLSGVAFSSTVYNVVENGVSATVAVLRSGYTNSIVSIDYATTDGTAHAGTDYQFVRGTLVFTNGETTKSFSVQVIDNNVLGGDRNLLLNLSNPDGNVLMSDPSAAVVNILENDGSLVVPSGSALVAESGTPNGLIETNETVSVLFGLRNASGTNTANLVATLLVTNGVVSPSAPQNYGALTVRGPSASRQFSFTAAGTNGQTIAATFRLVDGDATNYVSFPFALGRVVNSYSNGTSIVINDKTNATPYPATITVNGLAGLVTKATVTLTNFIHTAPGDVSILLVSPTGQKSYLMSKAGGNNQVRGATLTFDDDAALKVPQTQIVSGLYKPTSYALATPPFTVPVPPAPYATNLAVFNGFNPNGNWSLYVIDDSQLDTGSISNGWSLNLTTGGPVPPAADLGLVLTASTNVVVASSNITYTLSLTNYGPSTASNVIVSDTLPMGGVYLTGSATKGSAVTNAEGLLIWTVGTMVKDSGASLTFTAQATLPGTVTNSAVVSGLTRDPNPDDDYVQAIATVRSPTADLEIGLAGRPSPIGVGGQLTYLIGVTNHGPATATGVRVSVVLPADSVVSSTTPAGYTLAGSLLTFTNLAPIPSGSVASLVVVVKPLAVGLISCSAVCSSSLVDPLKGNNSASVKSLVEPLTMTLGRSANGIVITWPAGNFILESTPDLSSAVWTPVSAPQPADANGGGSVTLPTTQESLFFRLRAQ